MTTQQLPAAFVPVLAKLNDISPEGYEALCTAVEALDEPSGIVEFVERAGHLVELTADEARALLSMMLSTAAHAETSELDISELSDEMASSEALNLENESQQRLATRIKYLVEQRSTQVLHKSLALMQEHQSVFLDARILTDIRPVFGGEVSEGLDAVVLTHSLKIDFVREGKRKSFYLALDQSDLRVMKTTIERAIDKATSLRETLETAGIANLTLEA